MVVVTSGLPYVKTTRNNHAKKTDRMAVLERNRPAVRSGLPPDGVALHEARVGGGLQQPVFLAGRGQTADRPIVVDLQVMAALDQVLHTLCARREI